MSLNLGLTIARFRRPTLAPPDPFSGAQVGDYVAGGVYAGIITYADGRQFHLVAGLASSQAGSLAWGVYSYITSANDSDDGLANQEDVLLNHDDGTSYAAFYHCRDYVSEGHEDFYLPAENELLFTRSALSSHPEFSDTTGILWSSTEEKTVDPRYHARLVRFSDGYNGYEDKDRVFIVRPVRRVAV